MQLSDTGADVKRGTTLRVQAGVAMNFILQRDGEANQYKCEVSRPPVRCEMLTRMVVASSLTLVVFSSRSVPLLSMVRVSFFSRPRTWKPIIGTSVRWRDSVSRTSM